MCKAIRYFLVVITIYALQLFNPQQSIYELLKMYTKVITCVRKN